MTDSRIHESFGGVASGLDGWDVCVKFHAPTIEEIKCDLALRSPAWTRMLVREHRCVSSEAESPTDSDIRFAATQLQFR
jgi:hypothetical protein